MNILVTGGAGFIGSNLVQYLLGEAESDLGMAVDRVVTLDLLTYAGNLSNLDPVQDDPRHVFVPGDIGDQGLVGSILREHRIDAVMHLAAESHVDRSIDKPDEFISTNIVGTFHLLEQFRSHLKERGDERGDREVFLHVSTDEVFGSLGPDDPPFSELTPYAPNSPYSASKAGSDHLARAYFHTYRVPVIITNCSNNYGPYQFPEKLVPLMIGKLVKGELLPVYGDGRHVRDWIHVRDHCRGLVIAMLRGRIGETYLIGGGCEMTNIELVHAIVEAMRELSPGSVQGAADELITHVNDRPGHDRRYAIDPTRIKRELGWQAQEDIGTGLRRTVQWYLDHHDWINRIEDGTDRGGRLGNLI